METHREKIKHLLIETKEPLTIDEIAYILGFNPEEKRAIYEHLAHVAKSVRRESKGELMLFMLPPTCRKCGYVFKKLTKPKKPSKCPKCGSQRIESPKFIIQKV